MILLVTLLALILRLYHFSIDPPSLYIDEVAIGYNAYSILQTGEDEWGVRYPLLFRSFDDYKPPLYIYTVAVFEKFLGPSEAAVRLPAILSGSLTVLFLYFLVIELTRKKRLALVSSWLLAVSPWHLQFTRAGFEASETLLFVVIGTWLFFKATRKNIWWLLPALVFFSLSTMTYHNARVFVPLFLVVLFWLFRKFFQQNLRRTAIIILLVVIFNLPYASTWASPEGRARLVGESILSQPGSLIQNIQTNYVAKFGLDYLFFHGDQNGRHSVKKLGELYLWQLPFILAGLYFLVKKRNKTSLIVLAWLLLAPIPAAITKISPHALRGFLMVVPWVLVTAQGMSRRWSLIFLPIILFEMALYLHIYYFHYPKAYAADWSDGFPQTVRYLATQESNYHTIFVPQALSPMYLLFYLPYDPKLLQAGGHDTTVLGKYHYYDFTTAPAKESLDERDLVVAPKFTVPKKFEIKREIRMNNGDAVFEIYEY